MAELAKKFQGVREKVSEAFIREYGEHGNLDPQGEGRVQFNDSFNALDENIKRNVAKDMYKRMMERIIGLERQLYTSEEFVKNSTASSTTVEMQKLSKFRNAIFKSIQLTGKLTDSDVAEIFTAGEKQT